ncbi:hypothetical protein [Caballeronia novacaledonica]|uniref:hypothetical protein n=1 Tax=Caballeronia TaxID=1827195 RepID=UPI003857F113
MCWSFIPDRDRWNDMCNGMLINGFTGVTSVNTYWEASGKTFEDLDRYRTVLHCREWTL